MDEKIIYRLWRKYLDATRSNTFTDWKKYMLSCLRAYVFPPVGRGLDFIGFVECIKYNVFETAIEQKEPEIDQKEPEIEQEEIENEHE